MLSRRSLGLAVFVGGAIAVQLGLFLVSVAFAVCPETRAKSIVCPHNYDGECDGTDQPTCEADKAVSITYSQPLTDDDNSPEQTKTQTDVDEEDKVKCYDYQGCRWIYGNCFGDATAREYKVNPLETVDC